MVTELPWFEVRSRRHNVGEFGGELLRVPKQIGIEADLKDRIAFGLTRQFCVDYFIRPRSESAWFFDAPQNINATTPSRSLQCALSDNGSAAAHCVEGLGDSRRVETKAIDVYDRKTIRFQIVEIALLVQSAALGENFQDRIPD